MTKPKNNKTKKKAQREFIIKTILYFAISIVFIYIIYEVLPPPAKEVFTGVSVGATTGFIIARLVRLT